MLHNFSRNLSLIIAALFCAIALTSVVNANNTDDTRANSDILAELKSSLQSVIGKNTPIRSSDNRPNIVLFLADDTNWFDIGVYDRLYNYTPKNAITPNIDALAKEGMIFTSAFTSTAMCSPTRQQLYTGIYPVKSGAYPNHGDAYEGTKSLVHYFEDKGYQVALAGKGHIAPRSVYPFKKIGVEAKDDSGASTFGIEAVSDFSHETQRKPKIAFLGLSYKANVDDLRESPAVYIVKNVIRHFQDDDYHIVEPNLKGHDEFQLSNYDIAIAESDIIVVLVKHNEFRGLESLNNKNILDFCGINS